MKTLTGRAIIHYPYKNPFTGITHNSIILSLEGLRGKYGIPGGQFDPRFDKNTLETAIRELNEELGLTGIKESAELIYVFEGNVCTHDIYAMDAEGVLRLDPIEILGIGLLNAGPGKEIPFNKMERHAQALYSEYLGTSKERRHPSRIVIPERYMTFRDLK